MSYILIVKRFELYGFCAIRNKYYYYIYYYYYPSQHPHLIHFHSLFLEFYCCPCICHIQQCWSYPFPVYIFPFSFTHFFQCTHAALIPCLISSTSIPPFSTTHCPQVLEVVHLFQLFPWYFHCLSIYHFRLFEPTFHRLCFLFTACLSPRFQRFSPWFLIFCHIKLMTSLQDHIVYRHHWFWYIGSHFLC